MSDKLTDWMSSTVISVERDTPLSKANNIMNEAAIRRLTVLENGKLIGILSQGDIRAALAATRDTDNEPSVGAIMTPDPVTIPEDATVGLAAQTMLQLKLSGLPVVTNSGELCGMLSESDLFRYIIAQSQAS